MRFGALPLASSLPVGERDRVRGLAADTNVEGRPTPLILSFSPTGRRAVVARPVESGPTVVDVEPLVD
jgi:hypothetical protein